MLIQNVNIAVAANIQSLFDMFYCLTCLIVWRVHHFRI